MEEIFKDIYGYEGLYQISNLGRVKSLNYNKTRKEKILKYRKHRYGYLMVVLFKDGKRKEILVHRLVAQSFLPNPDNLPQVNHKDENKTNNCVENLEFCDAKYNSNYGTRNERVAKSLTGVYNTKKSKPVMCIETGVIYPSTNEVQRQLGFSRGNISQCCNGKKNTSYKYHWKYVD